MLFSLYPLLPPHSHVRPYPQVILQLTLGSTLQFGQLSLCLGRVLFSLIEGCEEPLSWNEVVVPVMILPAK